MTKKIMGFCLGSSQGNVMSWSMTEGNVILECLYSKNTGVNMYALVRDENAPKIIRHFVFYGGWSEPKQLDNRKRYWHVGTAYQKFDPTTNGYTPDDIPYFVFEVE